MARVEVGVAAFELFAGLEVPKRARNGDPDRVAGVDLENRRELAREVAVQRPLLERQLVECQSGHPLGEPLVARDEAVVVEGDLSDERSRAVTNDTVAERLIALLGARNL